MKTISVKNISELPQAAKQILEFARLYARSGSDGNDSGGQAEAALPPLGRAGVGRIFCFYGELGAGKTTLIKEICKQLGATDAGSSPTFALINEYKASPQPPPSEGAFHKVSPEGGDSRLPDGQVEGALYHFDLYRLKSESEIYDIGYEDYIFSGNYCFIEWPEKIEHLLPPDYVKVQIEVRDPERIISLF